MTETTWKETYAELVKKALADEEFKKVFIADPKAIIEEKSGKKLPEGLNVTVHMNDPQNLHLVLPYCPKDKGELSEEELSLLAGGTTLFGCMSKDPSPHMDMYG
jgi:hypothetical protein